MDSDQLEALTNTELRDELLAHSPLDRDWIAAINQARLQKVSFFLEKKLFHVLLIAHLKILVSNLKDFAVQF